MADGKDKRWTALSCVALQKFTNKKISVYLSDSSKRVGRVFSIDPVTHSVVLEEETEHSSETSKKLTFVSGHSISRVALEEDAESSKGPRRQLTDFIEDPKETQYSQEGLMNNIGTSDFQESSWNSI